MGLDDLPHRAIEGRLPAEQVEGGGAKHVEVSTAIDRAALGLLGGDVMRTAEDTLPWCARPWAEMGVAMPRSASLWPILAEQDVVRLDVAMDQAVRLAKARAALMSARILWTADSSRGPESLSSSPTEPVINSITTGHAVGGGDDIMDLDQVGMVERAGAPRYGEERAHPFRLLRRTRW